MPLSRPFPKIFINFYIFLSFWKLILWSYSKSFLTNCLQKCFLVTSLISTLTASILISFLDLNVSDFFVIWLLYRHFLIYKNQSLILRKYSVNKFPNYFVNGLHFALVTSYKFFKCSTGQLIECLLISYLNLSCFDSSSLGIFLVWILFL